MLMGPHPAILHNHIDRVTWEGETDKKGRRYGTPRTYHTVPNLRKFTLYLLEVCDNHTASQMENLEPR